MNLLHAILLGLVQGLTEFLPVSSSGHLVIFQNIFGIEEPMLFFDIMAHLGTLLAVFVFFRRDIAALLLAVFGRGSTTGDDTVNTTWAGSVSDGRRFALWVILGTVPAGIAGFLLGDRLEAAFSSLAFAGSMLFVTAALLTVTDFSKKGARTAAQSGAIAILAIGIAQAFAILPGISRSGSTICIAVLLGMERREAARFSFMLAIPVILGAALLQLKDVIDSGIAVDSAPVAAGAVVAFASGLLALKWLITALTRGRLVWFAAYCALAGAVAVTAAVL